MASVGKRNRLSEVRVAKDLSQNEVAESIGVSRATLSSIEQGKCDTLLKYSDKLAKLYDCSEQEIIYAYKGLDYKTADADPAGTYESKLASYREENERLYCENASLRQRVEELLSDKKSLTSSLESKDEVIAFLKMRLDDSSKE